MTRNDWLCPNCKEIMYKISDRFITCLAGHARLFNTWGVMDLPIAFYVRVHYYLIHKHKGRYRYVPRGHKEALGKCPAEGDVVARVLIRGRWKVRLLRLTTRRR
jgi:hypothetical protein